MKPTSRAAYYDILESYLEQMHGKMPDRCSSSTCSAVSLVWNDVAPEDEDEDDEDEDEDFYDNLDSIYEWTSTEEGLKDYLKNRFEEQLDYEGSADSAFFYIGDSEEYTLLDTDSQEKLVVILFKDDEMWDEIKSISSDFYEEIYYIKLSDVGSDEYYGDVKKMGTKNLFPAVLPAFYYIQNGIVSDVTYGFPEYIEKELETFFMN